MPIRESSEGPPHATITAVISDKRRVTIDNCRGKALHQALSFTEGDDN